MAIVPMFQGGVTQERDVGRDHAGEVQLARPTFDYAKNMEIALKPIAEAGKSITKALEIEANRNVKAEADEAEQKYLDIERRILYGPQQDSSGDNGFYKDAPNQNGVPSVSMPQGSSAENDESFYRDIPNGYFGQNGRNAVDTYGKSIEGLKKEARSILDNLSPWARESLQSRLADRINSAETRMLQWRNNQEQRWHLDSAKSRIDSLIRSAGDNPNNQEYLDKTNASIDAEVEYIGKLQGLDDQQISELRSKYRDLAQASRFSSWAQDNPIGALEAFQKEREGISRDVAQKLSDELFRTAKPQLGMLLAQQYGSSILDEKDFLRNAVTKGKKTGIASIDNLSTVQKASLWSSAHAFVSQQRAVAKSGLSDIERNALAETASNGVATNVPDKNAYIEAYGQEKGEKAYQDFQDKIETTSAIHNYAGMTDAEITADIEAAKPVPGSSDFADQKKLYDARIKAASEIMKKRREDSIQFASAGGQFGFAPIQNFSDMGKVVSQLQIRLEKSEEVAKAFGTAEELFSKAEIKELCNTLKSAPIEGRVGILSTISQAVGSKGIRIISNELNDSNGDYAIAMAGFDIPIGKITAGEKFLRGLDFISSGIVKVDERAEIGVKAQIAKVLKDDPAHGVRGVMDSPKAEDMTEKMAKGIYAYNYYSSGTSNAEGCVAEAVGGAIYTHNNRKIILPRGVDGTSFFGEDFGDLLNKQAEAIRSNTKERYSYKDHEHLPSEMARDFKDMSFKTEKVDPDGSVTYSVYYSDGLPVIKSGGKRYTFTLSGKKKEEK